MKAPDHDAAPESRRLARRGVELPCEIITQQADEPLAGRCSDLSPCGMALVTPAEVVEGDPVVLSFWPPRRGDELILFGRVRHAGEQLGVEFEGMTMEERIGLFDSLRGIPPRLPAEA